MGILASLGGSVVGAIVDKILAPFLALAQAYMNKQISMEELRSRMVEHMLGAFQAVEVSHSETLGKTYASFMDSASKSLLLRVVWASVTISQLLVLLWHQVGIPAYTEFYGGRYPSSGSTVEWAYALVGACVGMGPMVLRSGPSITDRLKAMIGR